MNLKYYWISLQIAILKPLVKLENMYNKYKEWRLKKYVNNYILAESNYDIETIKNLYNK